MKGIVFKGTLPDGTEFPYKDFPSVAFGSGSIDKEDIYSYAKRNISGTMRRINFVGYTLRRGLKWSVLKAEQYETLLSYITQTDFDVEFRWQGENRKMKFYAGNISATPYKLDEFGNPKYYTDVSFNIISLEVLKV